MKIPCIALAAALLAASAGAADTVLGTLPNTAATVTDSANVVLTFGGGAAYTPLADWPQTNNLLFAFTFGSDGTTDDSGNGHTLVYGAGAAAPTYVDATNGLSFDGTADFAAVGTANDHFNGLATATIACWAKRDATGTRYSMTPSNSTAGIGFQILTSGARGILRDVVTGIETMNTGTWYHHVLTFDNGATPDARLYVDGIYVQSVSIASGTLTVSGKYLLGAYTPASTFYDGNLDDVGGWTSVLTSNEVFNLYVDTAAAHP